MSVVVQKYVLRYERKLINGILQLVPRRVDGRPLYGYRVSAEGLDALEAQLKNKKCSDFERIQIMAPLAAGRFAANYDGGAPSWDDCGDTIGSMYQPGNGKFKALMLASFRHYQRQAIRINQEDLLLETVIRESGLASPMLADGKPLRKLLDTLMDRAVKGEDIERAAVELLKAEESLPKRYKDAGDLPALCSRLVVAVYSLKQTAGWQGGSLEPIFAIENWHRTLPIVVPLDRAKAIVASLLDAAEIAEGFGELTIERILVRSAGQWRLRARVVIPRGGIELDGEALPKVMRLTYTIDGTPTEEACRLQRKGDGGKEFQLALEPNELSETLAQPSGAISVIRSAGGGHTEPLAVSGGGPLDPLLPWIFAVRPDGRHVYLDSGSLKSRFPELLVAAPSGTDVSGTADALEGAPLITLDAFGQLSQRLLWKVSGRAEFRGEQGAFVVQAGHDGPQTNLRLSGSFADVRVNGCPAVFRGAVMPRREGGLSGRIQWRQANEPAGWREDVGRATGRVIFRLVGEREEVMAQRNALILPAGFKYSSTMKALKLTLGAGFCVPNHSSSREHEWNFEFGTKTDLAVLISCPGGTAELRFTRPAPVSFHNVVDGEQVVAPDRLISSASIGAFVARSSLHKVIFVQRNGQGFANSKPFPLRNGSLPLAEIKAYIESIAFDSRGRTFTVKVEFQNGPGLVIEAHRIKRNDDVLRVVGGSADLAIELHSLFVDGEVSTAPIVLKRIDKETWSVPPLDRGELYLAVGSDPSLAPCLVGFADSSDRTDVRIFSDCLFIADGAERWQRLEALFTSWIEHPHEGVNLGQIDLFLDWASRFKHKLPWLDPILVLTANPEMALKIVALAIARNHVGALQGMSWAFAKAPFFWHELQTDSLRRTAEWAHQHLDRKVFESTIEFIVHQIETFIQATAFELGGNPLNFVDAHSRWRWGSQRPPLTSQERGLLMTAFEQRRDRWQELVLAQLNEEDGLLIRRHASLNEETQHIRSNVPAKKSLDWLSTSIKNRVTNRLADVAPGFLLAPLDLAASVVTSSSLSTELRDDLIYARHLFSQDAFDDAFYYSLMLMERLE